MDREQIEKANEFVEAVKTSTDMGHHNSALRNVHWALVEILTALSAPALEQAAEPTDAQKTVTALVADLRSVQKDREFLLHECDRLRGLNSNITAERDALTEEIRQWRDAALNMFGAFGIDDRDKIHELLETTVCELTFGAHCWRWMELDRMLRNSLAALTPASPESQA